MPTQMQLLVSFIDQFVQAQLFSLDGTRTELLSSSQLKKMAKKPEEAVDAVLQQLSKESEQVHEVIYALPYNWLEDGDVEAEKKELLHQVTDKLALKATGFVSQSEALVTQLTQHHPHVSTIVLLASQENLEVCWVDKGSIVTTLSVGRSDNVAGDFVEVLARLLQQEPDSSGQVSQIPSHFPNSIYLGSLDLDHGSLVKLQQALLAVQWSEVRHFVHEPIINVVPADQLNHALIHQAGLALQAQLGTAVATSAQPAAMKPKGSQQKFADESTDSQAHVHGEYVEQPLTEDEYAVADNFQPVTRQDLQTAAGTQPSSYHAVPRDAHSSKSPAKTISTKSKSDKKSPLAAVMNIIHSLELTAQHHKMMAAGVGAGLIALLLLGVGVVLASPTVSIEVTPAPKTISNDVKITIDGTAGASDPENLVLAAELITHQVEGKKTGESTGVELAGEKATGNVEISNKTSAEKKFEPGSVVRQGDLRFVLNEEVTVPAAETSETDDGETKTFGKATVAVTAEEIGADYNLKSDEKLQVESFDDSSYEARVTDTFSGGSSREVRVVSATDQANLLAELKEDLLTIAGQELNEKATGGVYIQPTGTSEVVESSYDSEVGDEINTFTLSLTLEVEAYQYQAEDLQPLAQAVLSDLVPDNYTLSDEPPQILSTAEDVAETNGEVVLDANVSGKVMPNLDANQIREQVKGLDIDAVGSRLADQEGIAEVSYTIKPAFLESLVGKVPKKDSRIEVTILE